MADFERMIRAFQRSTAHGKREIANLQALEDIRNVLYEQGTLNKLANCVASAKRPVIRTHVAKKDYSGGFKSASVRDVIAVMPYLIENRLVAMMNSGTIEGNPY